MLTPDEETQQLLADPNPAQPWRELLLDHAERELSRDRSQHLASEHLDPLAGEMLASLPAPEGQPVGHTAADLLDQHPEPVGPRAHSSLADDLLAELRDPVDVEPDHADQVAKITARLDAVEQPAPSVADDFGIDLWWRTSRNAGTLRPSSWSSVALRATQQPCSEPIRTFTALRLRHMVLAISDPLG